MTKILFRPPTWKRYLSFREAIKKQSLLRCLEYERLALLGLKGRVLDFGGGRHVNYAEKIAEWGSESGFIYESANIDPNTNPHFLLDKSGRIPTDPAQYDAVISLNTLEHVSDLNGTLSELRRVSRDGARLILVVPFLFPVHGHPSDYHRGTPSFWEKILHDHNFKNVNIETLTWGPFSTASLVTGLPGPLKGLRRTTSLLLDLAYSQKNFRGRDKIMAVQDDPACRAPIAYFIEASAR
ncbi:bifunctional 2-polyprenyl-6-hydroxyphenol methylase/3-demethylubiquinol 3-O-methyltransferase UbiG [Thalassospira sp. TSL5-1]|uniref:class I SAM-dependent methyltransferase n=1 Tax=Thalassospira sp. TSL5-1 TaxID=1544451 RepID=UPI0009401F29|nr:methyltransferase domain-containing protein [Thalassospira sp. TSL5-1]